MRALDYAVRAGYLACKKTISGTVAITTNPMRIIGDGNIHVLATTPQQVRECIRTTNIRELVEQTRVIALVFEARECQ